MTRRTRGFTLIELMVSIALFGLIASGAMMLVMSGLRMQSHSARVDVAQSALRAGLDFMTRDILSASAGAASTTISIGGVATNTIQVTNNSLTSPVYSGGNADYIDIYMADSNYAYSTLYAAAAPGATTLTVDNTAQFTTTPPQLAMLTDLTNAVAINISSKTAPSGSPSIGTLTVTGVPSTLPGGLTTYSPVTGYVFALKHVRYSVGRCFPGAVGNADTQYANQGCLMMDIFDGAGGTSNPQPLAEGVEDLQIALGYDNNGDGNITDTSSNTDEWYGNASGEVFPATLVGLKAVRITIIAISTLNENANTTISLQRRPQAEDHAPATTYDGFFRRVIRSEITVRNFNI